MIFVVDLKAPRLTAVIVSSLGVYEPDSAVQLADPCVPPIETVSVSPRSVTNSCATRAAAIPVWSPHDLRHRRISLLHLRGVPWARIAEWVGQRKLSVTADTYTHVLVDETELDYAEMLAV